MTSGDAVGRGVLCPVARGLPPSPTRGAMGSRGRGVLSGRLTRDQTPPGTHVRTTLASQQRRGGRTRRRAIRSEYLTFIKRRRSLWATPKTRGREAPGAALGDPAGSSGQERRAGGAARHTRFAHQVAVLRHGRSRPSARAPRRYRDSPCGEPTPRVLSRKQERLRRQCYGGSHVQVVTACTSTCTYTRAHPHDTLT